ncbi:hypothetical protein BH20ACI2_BH20ACI2_13730 [soil metagenome]
MKIYRSAAAILDIIENAEYIAQDDLDAAIHFVDAVDRSISLIAESPGIGAIRKVGNAPEMRMWAVKGFPSSLLFYRATSTEIIVLRVIHSARDFNQIFDNG